jgi:hypothetical protein
MNNYKYIQIPIFFPINNYLKIIYNIFGLNIEKLCCENKLEQFINIYKKIGYFNNEDDFKKSIKFFAINLKNYDCEISFKHLKENIHSLFENILINIQDENFINIKNEKNENCFIINQNLNKILSKLISKKLKKMGINMNTKILEPSTKKIINYYKLLNFILNNNSYICSDSIINNKIKKKIGNKLFSLWINNAYEIQVFDNYKMFYNYFILLMYKQYKENLLIIDPLQLKLFNLFFEITLHNKIQNLKSENGFWDILLNDFEKLNENQLKKKYYGGKINVKIFNKLIEDSNKNKYFIGISLIFSSKLKKKFLKNIFQHDFNYYNKNTIIKLLNSIVKLLNKFNNLKNMIYENIWSIDHSNNIYTRLDLTNKEIKINNIWNIYTEPVEKNDIDFYIKDNKFDISTIFINKKKSETFFKNITNYKDFEWNEMYKFINSSNFFENYEKLKKNIIKINPIIIIDFLKAFNFQECELYNEDKLKEIKIETFDKWYNRHLIKFIEKNDFSNLLKINKKSSIKLNLFLNLFISFINNNKFILNKQNKLDILNNKLTIQNIKFKKKFIKLKNNYKNIEGGGYSDSEAHAILKQLYTKSLYIHQYVKFWILFKENMEQKNINVDELTENFLKEIVIMCKMESKLSSLIDGMIAYKKKINLIGDTNDIVDLKKIEYLSKNDFGSIYSSEY